MRQRFIKNLREVMKSCILNLTGLNITGNPDTKRMGYKPCSFYGSFLGEPEEARQRCLIYELSEKIKIAPPVKCDEVCGYGENATECRYMQWWLKHGREYKDRINYRLNRHHPPKMKLSTLLLAFFRSA